jgi:SAM-dependent methyltransferase
MRQKKFDLAAETIFSEKEKPMAVRFTPEAEVNNLMCLASGCKDWPRLLAKKRVLELGAGECTYLPTLLAKASPSRYVASDLFLDRMRFAAKVIKDPRAEFCEANILAMPFKDEEFDLVLAFGLLHHIPDLENALGEIRRLLAPGGLVLFRDPCAENLAVWLRFRFGQGSPNEWPLSRKRVQAAFEATEFKLISLNRFWLRFPQLPPGIWSTNLGGLAQKL